MALLNGLPVFKINFKEDPNEKSGIDFVSLVDYPAIESNWVAFSKEESKKPVKFYLDSDKQILYGPILIVDKPIYRYNEKTKEEYYVVFTKDVVEKLVRKLQKTGKTINLNYQHQEDSQLKEAVIQEVWLTGSPDKSNKWGFDLAEGSGFVGAYIGDSKFWNEEVKTGNVRGFSIEGFLDMEMKKQTPMKFTEVKVANDNSLFVDGEVAVGSYVYYNNPQTVLINGQKSEIKNLVWESNITLEDGTVLIIANGKIIEIPNKTKMSKDKFITAKTAEGVEIKSDAENFSVGSEVYTEVDNVKTPVVDGTYAFENGTMITVAGGKITEMVEEELSTEQVEVIQKAMKKVTDQFSATIAAQELRIKELETKLANKPGAPSATANTDLPATATKLSAKKQLETKLSILRKKSAEVATK